MTNLARLLGVVSLFAVQLGGCGGGSSGGGQTCSAVAPCGGTLDGTWNVESVCIGGNIGPALAASAGMPSACNSMYRSLTVEKASGTLTYSGGTETVDMTMTMAFDIFVSQSCVNAIAGGTAPLSASVCSALQQSLLESGSPFSAATCSYSGGGCTCSASGDTSDTNSSSYTASGHTITYSNGDTTDYCVAGDVLTERQASPPDLPGLTMVGTFNRAP